LLEPLNQETIDMEQGTSRSRRGLSGADTAVIVIIDVDTAKLLFMHPHPCLDICISPQQWRLQGIQVAFFTAPPPHVFSGGHP